MRGLFFTSQTWFVDVCLTFLLAQFLQTPRAFRGTQRGPGVLHSVVTDHLGRRNAVRPQGSKIRTPRSEEAEIGWIPEVKLSTQTRPLDPSFSRGPDPEIPRVLRDQEL